MEGKRFGVGLAAGLLLALALVAVSGGLGSASLPVFGPAPAASTTTAATTTVTMSVTTTSTATYALSSTTTSLGTPLGSLSGNVTSPRQVATTTTTSPNPSQAAQTAANNANNGATYSTIFPSGAKNPTHIASIAQQPLTSNAVIVAPVLAAFLLGAFLYRVVVQEKERPDSD